MAFTKYDSVIANDGTDLATQMAQRIKDGWQPYGQPVMYTANNMVSAQIVQAVVQGTADGTASYQLPAAAAGKLGGVALANAVSDSSASDVSGINKTLNALLASLRDAGVIAKS